MTDRSIPFYNVILRCDIEKEYDIHLPKGYSFERYNDGFEDGWAKLEYETGDFESFEEAKRYFIANYLSDKTELIKRGVFLINANRTVVGSCIAWKDLKDGEKAASLHWLIVSGEHRGIGLGRALCQRVMNIFAENGELPVYIHTQPWSWKAILLYISLGFRIQRSDTFSDYQNQYSEAMAVLKDVVSQENYRLMTNASAD